MHRKSPRLLEDILEASALILEWTRSVTIEEYEQNGMLRSAVERQFLIVGEALVRLERIDAETAERIPEWRAIVGFRNRLAHGYDATDNEIGWRVVKDKLPRLIDRVTVVLTDREG